MNALFQQEEGKDATVENLEYSYWFDENKGEELTADVEIKIDMTVSGATYEIEAEGEVSGEKLSSGIVLWIGPLEGELEINNIEYLVMVGFTKMDELVQISVTIQSMDDKNVIEPVHLSFGDNVITEDIYQEIEEKKETVDIESKQARSMAGSTYTMNSRSILNQPQLEGGGGTPARFQLKGAKYAYFESSPINGVAQILYGYFDKSTNRLAVSLRTCCSSVDEYFDTNVSGYATTEIERMKYVLKTGSAKYSKIDNMEYFDFNVMESNLSSLLVTLFSDAIALLNYTFPIASIYEILESLYGNMTGFCRSNHAMVEVKFGAYDHANFDAFTAGVPIIFLLEPYKNNTIGTQDYILETSITYRSMVFIDGFSSHVFYYNKAQDAKCEINLVIEP